MIKTEHYDPLNHYPIVFVLPVLFIQMSPANNIISQNNYSTKIDNNHKKYVRRKKVHMNQTIRPREKGSKTQPMIHNLLL